MNTTAAPSPTSDSRLTLPELEDYIRSIDTAMYTKQRNYIGGSTRLSEYISRGMISLPRVRDLVLIHNTKSTSFKFLGELAWREYWQLTWEAIGDDIFEYIRPLPNEPRDALPLAITNASTGIQALDNGITQLKQTGFIDNHMRMWLAGLISNVARCDWKVGATWMHSQLIDGDYASNHLSWQWVAGSYTGKAYVPQQDNINKYTESLQKGTFLDRSYADIASMDIPEPLLDAAPYKPDHSITLPDNTITIEDAKDASTVLLYSPWTLDPLWRNDMKAAKILFIDTDEFGNGRFSQNVIDSIIWFASQIPDLKILCAPAATLNELSGDVYRKSYPGIAHWPGTADPAEKLHPEVPVAFYKSYSAYWKQIKKYSMTDQQSLFDGKDVDV